ncbi:phage tail sheath subtilisin-like domain-containing protein [Jingyaoa shaoxingensis]|uniref:Phage tail sheath subtilisin-like domain-containing protein n=1 Tax=Jingyaoa shaoxingensis TaxID=2763671 RepID=A0ABR7NB83_9FIRM|nr:phage tail sheath subtilisin-like domain-containing protein [Jingyaoa shaoxingensis]MBC8573666.1 phage tail sheath subtilisin-like domain-containing protein [Jingyaoa shaoxingensis]
MAGGTFKLSSPKVRPGAYVVTKNGKQPTASNAPSGIAIIPLIGYDWGPRGEMIHLTNESPDAAKVKFGRSIYDDNECMVMLQLMFLNATEVYTYIAGGGEKAKGTITLKSGTGNVTAKYPGTLGNKIKVVSVANPEGGFDVSVVLDGSEVELIEGATKVTDLKSDYVDFAGEGELAAFASASLTGGTNEDSKVNASVATFLDMAEKIKFNCMALPTSEASLITAAVTKIKYIRNSIGWKCGLVVANSAADYENIYNLTNAAEYAGEELTIPQSVAWLAGAIAAAGYTSSLTYKIFTGATGVVGAKTNEEAIQAIKKGEIFFTVSESGDVIVEYDVNSKVTFTQDDPADIMKGRPCRVYDSFANDLLLTFVPGRFNNDPTGWTVMEGLGRAILKAYQNDGAIQNVDEENDFLVDRGASTGDSVYISCGIQPVDSAEKYYFTVIAR